MFDYGLVGFAEAGTPRSSTQESDEATKEGVIIGTPAYMAPEQFSGGGIGPWTDIYGLGASAWQALVGKPHRSGSLSKSPRRLNAVRSRYVDFAQTFPKAWSICWQRSGPNSGDSLFECEGSAT